MDEILELRKSINEGRYADALHIIDELEEMAKDDKLDKIFSYMQILLIHLIKQNAENRTTRSWDNSIKHSLYQIERVNKRRKSGGIVIFKLVIIFFAICFIDLSLPSVIILHIVARLLIPSDLAFSLASLRTL